MHYMFVGAQGVYPRLKEVKLKPTGTVYEDILWLYEYYQPEAYGYDVSYRARHSSSLRLLIVLKESLPRLNIMSLKQMMHSVSPSAVSIGSPEKRVNSIIPIKHAVITPMKASAPSLLSDAMVYIPKSRSMTPPAISKKSSCKTAPEHSITPNSSIATTPAVINSLISRNCMTQVFIIIPAMNMILQKTASP